jgi:hypothetical protein
MPWSNWVAQFCLPGLLLETIHGRTEKLELFWLTLDLESAGSTIEVSTGSGGYAVIIAVLHDVCMLGASRIQVVGMTVF